MTRRLSADERRLWDRFTREVRRAGASSPLPFRGGDGGGIDPPDQLLTSENRAAPTPSPSPEGEGNKRAPPPPPKPHANTLDTSWDKRLSRGAVTPDRTIDLHGHTLATAHTELDRRLGEAVRSGARLVLLITGRPARDNPRLPPTSRGVIRASVMDWIAAGSHAGQIAAVRNAHPRHGGAGALYLILRRGR